MYLQCTTGQTYHGHVRLDPTQRPRLCDGRQVLAERRRIERIAQCEQRGQALERRVVEAIEIGQVAGLVDFVDIGLLWREGNVLADFIADIAEKFVVDEILDDCVFVAAGSLSMGWQDEDTAHTAVTLHSTLCIPRAPCCQRVLCESCHVPRRQKWLASSSPCRRQARHSCAWPLRMMAAKIGELLEINFRRPKLCASPMLLSHHYCSTPDYPVHHHGKPSFPPQTCLLPGFTNQRLA